MLIRKIEERDAENFLSMLIQLDSETKNMMYEPGERKTTLDQIGQRIKNTAPSGSLTLVAEIDAKIVGFLAAERGFANRIRHSAYIVTGILEAYRGKGIGTGLFEILDKWALESEITRLELTVMTHNEAAKKLYEKMGFKIEGTKEKSLIVDGRYVDEYYMAKLY